MVSSLERLKGYNIILASASPRRKELLSKLDIDFNVKILPDIDESFPANMPVVKVPQHISRKKAEAYRSGMGENDLVIAADTIVAAGRRILGKPADETAARDMLKLLSGRSHRVITGVTIMTKERMETFSTVSRVCFDVMSDEEIDYYVNKYRPFDKAGAYGIQEWIGMIGVSELHGSYFNVMGLPVQRLYARLKTF